MWRLISVAGTVSPPMLGIENATANCAASEREDEPVERLGGRAVRARAHGMVPRGASFAAGSLP